MQSTVVAPTTWGALYRNLLREAREIDELGFDSLWLAEHRFSYDGWCPQPLLAASAVAAVAPRLRLGTAVHVLPQHDALAVAEAVAELHARSGGRVDFGVGVGHHDTEFDGLGLRRRERGARLDEALDVLRLAWSGRQGTFAGKHFAYPSLKVADTPFEGSGPRLWLGGDSAPALRRIARRGAGAILPPKLSPEELATIRAKIRAEADLAGVSPGPVGVILNVWVDEDESNARRFASSAHEHYRERQIAWDWRTAKLLAEDPEEKLSRRARSLVVGSPKQVLERLIDYRDAGADLIVGIMYRDFTRRKLSSAVRLFASDVLPELRQA
jgi:alkanesulfonate monooxygenase SsuD/methylene tetrahydromethanopterin reductase-like flavin-dependent oxidoreductase (luciferase family)